MNADELAQACADAMWAEDNASQGLGMEILSISAGRSELKMTVRADMTNGHRICHGGFIFLLADSAFAFACNGYNQRTVAQACKIDFLAPASEGDVLRAIAQEQHREGRSGIYDCVVTDQNDKKIAIMRGNSRSIRGSHLPEGEEKH